MPGAIWKRWNWLEAGLIPLVLVGVRAAWLAPLLRLLLNNGWVVPVETRFPAWLIMALLLAPALVRALPLPDVGRQGMAVLGGLAATLGTWLYLLPPDPAQDWGSLLRSLTTFEQGIPAPLVVLVTAVALWRQGLRTRWNAYDALWRSFVNGVLVLGGLMLLPGRITQETAGLDLGSIAFAFLLLGLLALALLAVVETVAPERERGTGVIIQRYWLLAVGLVIVLVLAGGWLLGRALSPGAVAEALGALRPLVRLLEQALVALISALAYVVFWLLAPLIEWLRSLMMQRESLPPSTLPNLNEPLRELQPERPPVSPGVETALRLALLAVVVAGAVLAFWRARQRRERSQETGVLEQREFIWSKALLAEQLHRLVRRRKQATSEPPFLVLSDLSDPRQAIRQLYQKLLEAAQRLGQPRSPGTTPTVYQETLATLVPGEQAAVQVLTAAYLQARYAAEPPTPAQVAEARAAWARLEAALSPGSPVLPAATPPPSATDSPRSDDPTDTPGRG